MRSEEPIKDEDWAMMEASLRPNSNTNDRNHHQTGIVCAYIYIKQGVVGVEG